MATQRALVNLLVRRIIPFVIVASFMAALALAVPRGLTAKDDGRRDRACSDRTLRGDYGILISGIVPSGPTGQTESIVGVALRTYDGHGNFTQIDNVHGQVSGAIADRQGSGTYQVNADCSGTTTLFLAGVPFPSETSIVIVDGGREIKEVVMSPPPALVTAIQTRE